MSMLHKLTVIGILYFLFGLEPLSYSMAFIMKQPFGITIKEY